MSVPAIASVLNAKSDVAPDALSVLNSVFGLPAFRGAQEEIVRHVTDGGNCLVLMPTGGGKSLCYQIPALVRKGVGVVVSPLIALMKDQAERLEEAGVAAEQGIDQYLWLMALLSINLALLNFLPVPILDGGMLVFFTIELFKRRPPSVRAREIASYIGLVIVAVLMLFALRNDVVRYLLPR
jgi:membrane-associated protease RseP (regulator of RpoE activity)